MHAPLTRQQGRSSKWQSFRINKRGHRGLLLPRLTCYGSLAHATRATRRHTKCTTTLLKKPKNPSRGPSEPKIKDSKSISSQWWIKAVRKSPSKDQVRRSLKTVLIQRKVDRLILDNIKGCTMLVILLSTHTPHMIKILPSDRTSSRRFLARRINNTSHLGRRLQRSPTSSTPMENWTPWL